MRRTRLILNDKKSLGYLEGWLSVLLNTALFSLKLWTGLRIGSVAMAADAWHTLSDSLTSVVVILGFWLSAKPADDKHGFGHGRAEAVASLIIGTLLAVAGFNFLKESVFRLIDHRAADFDLFAILVFAVSAVVKEALAQFSLWAGRKTGSRSLVADAWHHRSDAIASGLIVVAALAGGRHWWVDGVLGLGVSLLILYSAYAIIRSAASYLLGESLSGSLKNRIQETILNSDSRLETVHHLHVHEYGDHKEVTAHVCLPGGIMLDDAHAIATQAEKDLREKLNMEPTIHIEPCKKNGDVS